MSDLWFPNDRVAPIIQAYLDGFGEQRGRPRADAASTKPGTVIALAERSGVSEQTIRAILHGRRAQCRLGNLDAILCALDRTDLFHVCAEHGGFADIYERPVTEQLEARRAYQRDYMRRLRQRKQKKAARLGVAKADLEPEGLELAETREAERLRRERKAA